GGSVGELGVELLVLLQRGALTQLRAEDLERQPAGAEPVGPVALAFRADAARIVGIRGHGRRRRPSTATRRMSGGGREEEEGRAGQGRATPFSKENQCSQPVLARSCC